MKRTLQVLLTTVLASGAVLLTGCDSTEGRPAKNVTSGIGAPEDVVAVVAGKEITLGDIETLASGGLVRVRQQRYDVLRGTLERLGIKTLIEAEAESRGITSEELRIQEIEGKIEQPTDSEIERMYEANRHRAGGKSLQELRNSIRATIYSERLSRREERYMNELKEKYGFSVTLPAPRVDLSLADDAASRGDENAPVTLVEFGDYQCPFCRRAHTTVQRVLNEYGDQIRYVFLDYPLGNHDRAVPAAEAAYCAGEQDKYWDYSEHLMMMAGDLNDNDLRGRAEQIGLDVTEFMSCYTSGRHTDRITAAQQTGSSAGVDSTPTFFINGRMLVGAKNFETFKLIIDEELAALGS